MRDIGLGERLQQKKLTGIAAIYIIDRPSLQGDPQKLILPLPNNEQLLFTAER